MQKILFFTCVSLFFSAKASAQDPVFLNANQSLIYLNPSFAGSNGGVRDQLSYNRQWPLLSGRYVTYANSLDLYIKPLKAGIALTWVSDNAAFATLKTNSFSFAYAQHLNFGEHLKVIPSVQFTYAQRNLDVSNLTYGNLIDPRGGIVWSNPSVQPQNRKTYVSASAGLLINVRKNLYIGAYVFQMNQPDEGLMCVSKLPARFLFHASYNLKVSDKIHLQFFYRLQSQNYFFMNQMAVNAVFFEHLITGVGYAVDDVAFMNVGYKGHFVTVLLGYNQVVSKLAGNTVGGWEIHTSFNFRDKENWRMFTNIENW